MMALSPTLAQGVAQMHREWKTSPKRSARFNRKHEAGNAVGSWVVQAMHPIGPAYYLQQGSITCGTTSAGWCRLCYLVGDAWVPYQPDGNNVLVWVHNPSAYNIAKGQFLLSVRILSGTVVVAEPYGICTITPSTSGSASDSGSGQSDSGSGDPPSGSGSGSGESSGSGTSDSGSGSGSGSGGSDSTSGDSGSGGSGSGSGSASGSGSGSGPSTSGSSEGSECEEPYSGNVEVFSTEVSDCQATTTKKVFVFKKGLLCKVDESSPTTVDLGDCCCGGNGSDGSGSTSWSRSENPI